MNFSCFSGFSCNVLFHLYLYNLVKSNTKFVNFANIYKKPTVSFTNLLFSYSLFYSFLL